LFHFKSGELDGLATGQLEPGQARWGVVPSASTTGFVDDFQTSDRLTFYQKSIFFNDAFCNHH